MKTSLLGRLIFSDIPAKDGLTQPEREAIVDALHYCTYVDAQVSLSETKVIQDWQEKLAWAPNLPFSTYEPRSIAAARQALESIENRNELISLITKRIKSKHAAETLLRLCRKLADADGRRSQQEWAFIEELRKTLEAA